MATQQLKRVRIAGFRSLKEIELHLAPVTVLIGPNGASKSNVLWALEMVRMIALGSLQLFVGERGGATFLMHGPAVLASVEAKLVAAFGSPAYVPEDLELRTDHGPQYTGADCAAFCARWRLHHTFAPVGRPTGNAVVERFIRTLKEELIWLRDWESADELRVAIATWLEHYLTHRPHQALSWQTPTERRAERLARPVAIAV